MKSVCIPDETLYQHKENILGHKIVLQQTLLRSEHLSSNVHRLSGVVSYVAKRWIQKPNGLWQRNVPDYRKLECNENSQIALVLLGNGNQHALTYYLDKFFLRILITDKYFGTSLPT